jgi:L-lactate dehydrogenase complex protein LldE
MTQEVAGIAGAADRPMIRAPGAGMRVALFITCFNDLLYPEVGQAVVQVLRRLGCEVDFPEAQTCCGQMHFNSGYRDDCVPLARNFAAAFAGYDAIVTPSPSCASMVRHFYPVVAEHGKEHGGEAGLGDTLNGVAGRVYELTEFLVDVLGVEDVGARFPHTVTFHPTCHSVRVLGIGDRPQRLLNNVQGLEHVALPDSDQCCGFGGTFSVKNAEVSIAMGADKVSAVLATGAEVLTSADTSCLMHIGGMLSRNGAPTRVLHLAEILAAQEEAS